MSFFFFQAEDGIRDLTVTGVQTCALPISFWDWHPTRREMIIGTRFGDAQQLHRVRSPGGDRTQLTCFPDPVSGASYQPTEGRYIVFTKDVGGAELFQKYRYDVATGEITLLTDGKSRNVGGAWSHKGDRYAYMSTRRNGRDLDLWVVEPSNSNSDHMVLELQGGGYAPVDWSPDDRTMLLWQGRSEEHTSELQSQSNLVCRLLLEKKKIHCVTRATTHAPHV